tara:strand:- start:2498 stop:3658 length:1161 start_codon:yes stop_codon:yes gene_type:complete
MKVIFFHDNIITVKNQNLYSSGGLNEKVISRYLSISSKFSLGSRNDDTRVIDTLSFVGTLDEVEFHKIPNLAGLSIKKIRIASRILSEVIDENDFIIIRLPSIIGLLALFITKKKKKNYLIELVGCPWDSYRLHSVKGKIIALPMFLLTKFFIKNADHVLYVTNNFLQNRYPTKSKKQMGCSDVELLIEEGVLENKLSKLDLGEKGRKIKIGMIGFIEAKYKGFDTAIMALSLLKKKKQLNYNLEIVGGGNSEYLEKLIKKYNVTECVTLIGVLSHPKGIFNWLDSIDIYLQPSKTEGLPRALIEAMGRSCACIGANSGEIPQLLESKYIHEKGSFKKLSELIIEISKDNNIRSSARNNFIRAQQYDKKILDERRELFYKQCMGSI